MTAPPALAPSSGDGPITSAARHGGRIPGLDGLRAVSVVAVLAYHAGFGWASAGFLGVSQFFTLSGFLVTGLLLREHRRDGTISLRRFWARRFRRLLPGAFLALLLAAVFVAVAGSPEQADALPRQVAGAALYVANWEFLSSGTSYAAIFDDPSPVQHFWSLSIEEQFYLVVPVVLIGVLSVVRSRRVLLAIVVGAAAIGSLWARHRFGAGEGFDRVYFGTDTRLPEILGGAALSVVFARRAPWRGERSRQVVGWTGAASLVGVLWAMQAATLEDPRLWRGGMAVVTVATAATITGILTDVGPLRVLNWRPLVGLGRISYGIYLYHWPIFLWLDETRIDWSAGPLFALRVAITIAVAALSFRFVEEPIRTGSASLGSVLPSASTLRWAAVPAAIALVVGTAAVVERTSPDPDPRTFGSERLSSAPVDAEDPVLDVLVVADDLGRPAADALRRSAAGDTDLEVVVAETFHCTEVVVAGAGDRTCENWQEWTTLVDEHDPDAVLLLVRDWPVEDLERLASGEPPDDLVRALMGEAIDILSARGAPVTWTSITPDLPEATRLANQPFDRAMRHLQRTDERVRRGAAIPYADDPSTPEAATAAAEHLIGELSKNRRRTGNDRGRVMVVGDSQAQSLAFGLERWTIANDGPTVWNAGVGGCGLVAGGEVIAVESGVFGPPSENCDEVLDGWAAGVESFRPDRVLVLTSIRDLQPRRLDGWPEVLHYGDEAFDAHVLTAYEEAVDRLTATGAEVMWLAPPCLTAPGFGYTGPGTPLEPAATDHLSDVVLAELVRRRPEVDLYPLDDLLCPDGEPRSAPEGVGDLRPDGIHLSAEGSGWVADRIGADLLGRP